TLIGTPEDIVDQMEVWFEAGVADGFNLMPPTLPGRLEDFVELIVPAMQKRGIFREKYEGHTFRVHLVLIEKSYKSTEEFFCAFSVFRLYFSVRKLILHETSHLTTDDAVDIDSLTLIRWTLFYKIRSYIHLASFSTTSFNRCVAIFLINLVGKG